MKVLRVFVCLAAIASFSISFAGCGSPVAGADKREGHESVSAPIGSDAQTEYMAYTETAALNDSYMTQLSNELSGVNVDADFVNRVTEDRQITAEEMNEAERRAINCLSNYGLVPNESFWFGKNTGFIVDENALSDSDTNKVDDECLYNTGYAALKSVYLNAVRNPNNIDLDPYRFQCYKDYKLIDQDYSYEQFQQELNNGKSPLSYIRSSSTPGYDDFMECVTDPLHHMKSK